MLVVFSPIFVADTKIISGYNFVIPFKRFCFDYSLQHKVRLCEKHGLCYPFLAVKVFCLTSLDSILLYLWCPLSFGSYEMLLLVFAVIFSFGFKFNRCQWPVVGDWWFRTRSFFVCILFSEKSASLVSKFPAFCIWFPTTVFFFLSTFYKLIF